ncbi:protein phosphatase 2C domain-containing protein [Cylindrospermopsis raciborskii]|uniref:protein phosphatase 2C domain-containing protein n=1 Tax=Cylindrospermopsis raciborskii TaxID=77022 RepID=UPI000A77B609
MENEVAMLFCPNEYCQAPNPLNHRFCQRCSTPLPKRYLWTVGVHDLGNPGEIVGDRYVIIERSIILDLKPGLPPQAPELVYLDQIKPYLKLIPYRLHVPQIYGVLSITEQEPRTNTILLEAIPLIHDNKNQRVHLWSDLITAWGKASSIRQINWLWQMAKLWQPLYEQGVASSLLSWDLIRVQGGLVKLLELRSDRLPINLSQLGKNWQQLLASAQPCLVDLLEQVCESLIKEEISSSEHLTITLDQALSQIDKLQKNTSSIDTKILTQTDPGPSRQRNEDSCYPPPGIVVSPSSPKDGLAIVCDGIGGHEGGNVASDLAVKTIVPQVEEILTIQESADNYRDLSTVVQMLEQGVALANDKISQQNDIDHRQGRQRMGTTLVMAIPIAHQMYITHVGDSRAYWITHHGCYQVTLDDDVASREVRLGYATYREAIQHRGSGSLIQALGMGNSALLSPTCERFILDEDGIFLLSSDGLTDFDRVEDYWETEILPVLRGESNLETTASRLVEIANTKNGHDNVTIALLHYQVQYQEPNTVLEAKIPPISFSKTVNITGSNSQARDVNYFPQSTRVIPENPYSKDHNRKIPIQLLILLAVVLAAGFLGFWPKREKKSPVPTPTPSISQSSGAVLRDNLILS